MRGITKKATAVTVFAVALASSPVLFGADERTPANLLQAYDAVLLDKLRKYDGTVKTLMSKDMMTIARAAVDDVFANEIRTGRWDVLLNHGDSMLSAMPERAGDDFVEKPSYLFNTKGEMATALGAMGVGTRASMRLWDPHSVINTFSQMALGKFLGAEKLAFNTVASGMISTKMFRTKWRGEPAIGVDQGLWTVVISYERDGQGSFLPLAIGVFER